MTTREVQDSFCKHLKRQGWTREMVMKWTPRQLLFIFHVTVQRSCSLGNGVLPEDLIALGKLEEQVKELKRVN